MEKYKVNINEQVKDINYETFIFEDNKDNNKNIIMMDFSKLKNKLLNNL